MDPIAVCSNKRERNVRDEWSQVRKKMTIILKREASLSARYQYNGPGFHGKSSLLGIVEKYLSLVNSGRPPILPVSLRKLKN